MTKKERAAEAWKQRPPIEVGNVVQLVRDGELLTREVVSIGSFPPQIDHVMVAGIMEWIHIRHLTVVDATLPEYVKGNFNTLQKAFENGDVCLMSCFKKNHPEITPTICAVSQIGDEYHLTPFAMMFTENPFVVMEPPTGEYPRKSEGEYPLSGTVRFSDNVRALPVKCEHELDVSTIAGCRDVPGIVDVVCEKCGASGSMQVDATDFDFGDD